MHQGHELVEANPGSYQDPAAPGHHDLPGLLLRHVAAGANQGAGAAAQNAIGTAVTGGLLSATFIDLIFIPFFFVLVSRLFGRGKYKPQAAASAVVTSAEGQ